MVGHPAYPDKAKPVREVKRQYYLERVSQIVGGVVKSDVSQPGADDKARDGPDEDILDGFHGVRKAFVLNPVDHKKIGDQEGNDVHQAVIAKLERPYLKQVRADVLGYVLPEGDKLFHRVPF